MMTTSKRRLGWMVLAVLLVITSLSVQPVQGDARCNLADCIPQCEEGCAPYGGHPATCNWQEFSGQCVGICWCYYW